VFVVCDFHTPVALECLCSPLLPKVDLTPVAQKLVYSKSNLTPVAQKRFLKFDPTPVARKLLTPLLFLLLFG
jgi:hypothetical protein